MLVFLLLLFAALAALAAMELLLRRPSGRALPWRALPWTALLSSALVLHVGWPPGPFALNLALGALFAPLLLAAEIDRAGRRIPAWLLAATLVLAVGRGFSGLADPHIAPLLALTLDPLLLAAAGWIGWRALTPQAGAAARLAPLFVVLLCVPRVLDALHDLRGESSLDLLALWVAFAIPVLALQAAAELEEARRQTRRAQAALRESVGRFEIIADSAFDLIAETDGHGRFLYASPSYRTVLGLDPDALRGTNALTLIHPDDVPLARASGRAVNEKGQLAHPRLRIRHGEGSWRELEGTAHRYWAREGEERVVIVSRDVTDRSQLEYHARNAQRLESLGLLATGIAHELNNLLVPVLTSTHLLREQIDAPSAQEILADVEEGAVRASDLTEQLLAFAGRNRREIAPVDLSEVTGHVLRIFVRTLAPKVTLRSKLSSGLPTIAANPAQLRELVTILLANAQDAMGDAGGVIGVETGVVALGPGTAQRLELDARLPPGIYAYLEVSDDGSGMDEVTRARIFDPFFSTRPSKRGLGLALLMGTVRSYHGGVALETAPGQGSRLRLLFPVEPVGASEAVRTTPTPSDSWQGEGTILLVDDEDTVRRATRRALERLGFRVVEARNGVEAVALYRRIAADVDAVVLDVVMPVLQGDEAYLEMARVRADVPVLVTSGFTERDVTGRFPPGMRVGFLAKPYTIAELRTALHAILAPGGEPDA